MTLWKTLNGRTPTIAGGDYRYPVGQWTEHLDPADLDVCGWGYHLARDEQVLGWLNQTLYRAEPCLDHELIEADDKVVTCRVRLTKVSAWDDRTARLFAADCAEHVLHFFEDKYPDDDRPRKAIETVRLYANGKIDAAAWAAAWAAAGAAAGDAAWDAAGAAAGAAAREAARAAARDAAGAAARAAERAWQYQTFLKIVGA